MESAIVRWYDEVKKYRFDGESFISGTGHFTQVCPSIEILFCLFSSLRGPRIARIYSRITDANLDVLKNPTLYTIILDCKKETGK